MRRLFVVFIIPVSVLTSIVLLFTLLNASPASAFPSLSHEPGQQRVAPAAAVLPVSEPEFDPPASVAPASGTGAEPRSSQPEAALSVAAPQASLEIQVNYAHEWVAGTADPDATVVVTVTNGLDELKADAVVTAGGTGDFFVNCDDWSAGECPDIVPGDIVRVWAEGLVNEINPIGTISGVPDEDENTVSGELNANWFDGSLDVRCSVWGDPGSSPIDTSADSDGGVFTCDFDDVGWDLQQGQMVALSYYEPDGDQVINIVEFPWMRVNYGHDWVGGNFAAGHTFAITVTDDLGSVKATAVVDSIIGGSGLGAEGFQTNDEWSPVRPDIQPGDFVYFATGGYTNVVQVGHISGNIDVATDEISGTVTANFGISLTVECHPWGAWDAGIGDAQTKNSWAEPDESVPYSCAWDPATEWDILPGQQIGVTYWEPDGDAVTNSFTEPAANVHITKSANGAPAEGGNFVYRIVYWNEGDAPAANVVITDTNTGGLNYLSDTSGLPHTGSGAGPIVWEVGALDPGPASFFDVYYQVTAGQGETVNNTASIATSSFTQGEPGDRTASWENQVMANDTQLNLGKWAWTGDPTPGETFVFTVNSCNNGGTASTEVTVTDDLPPYLTLNYWWGQDPGWVEIYSDAHQLIGANPSLPGNSCSEIYLSVTLDGDVPIGAEINNTATIVAANDLTPDDNEAGWGGNAAEPHTNLWINKLWNQGSLVPGGQLNYIIQYGNDGNVPVGPVTITDTLPEGAVFTSAWFNDNAGGYDFVPSYSDSDIVVWQLGGIANGESFNFNVSLAVDPAAIPGTALTNQVDITWLPGEDGYGDNTAQWTEQLNPSGPNLRIYKDHYWNGDGQLGYNIYFENIGDETINDLWITDTLPVGTGWDGWWDSNWDWSRFITFTPESGLLKWHYADFNPQEIARISFNANLDEPGVPLRWYSNNVEVTLPPGDPTSDDNDWEDIAFSGGELRRVELWINAIGDSNMWGEAVPGYPITVTLPHGQYFASADSDCGGCWNIDNVGVITPGITIVVEAGPALQPVTIVVPDPLEAHADSATEEVFGQIGGWFNQNVEIHGDFGYQEVSSDGAGNFLALFPDIPRGGGGGYIRFVDQVDYAEVIYHRPFYALDLVLDVNYGHDSVEGNYELGHTVWITVTESDGATVKGLAELQTGYLPDWNDPGFSTNQEGWLGDHPDLQPNDFVYGKVDNGYQNQVQLGDIQIELNLEDNVVFGQIIAPWLSDPLPVTCSIRNVEGGPFIDLVVPPDPGFFSCDFGALGWALGPGQTIAVSYLNAGSDRVYNTFDWPILRAEIGPASDGERHVWGHYAGANATVTVTVETALGAAEAETTILADSQGNFDTGQNLPEGSLGVWNWVKVSSSSGITAAMQIYPMGAETNMNTDVITVTAAGPPSFTVNLQYCEPGWCDWYNMGNIGGSGVLSVDLQAERGFDIRPGTHYYAALDTQDGHNVNYMWELPAPELSLSKWNTNGHARPDGYVVYNIQYQNSGNGPAENVTIVDTLPAFTTYYGDTGYLPVTIGPGNVITWDLGDVPVGENERFVVVLHVDPGAPNGSAVIGENCAEIYTTTEGDSNPGDNGQCAGPVDVWDNDVALSVSKNANPNDPTPGQEFDYNINWCNNRGAAAGPVVLTDTLPAGVSLIGWWPNNDPYWSEISFDGNELVLYAPALPGNLCDNITLRVLLDEAVPVDTSLENLVVLDVAGDVNPDDNWQLDSNTHVGPPRYDLRMDKTFNNGILTPGGYASFSVDYTNNGNVASTVRITDTLPPGFTYLDGWWTDSVPWPSQTFPDPVVLGNQLVWDLPEVPVNRWHGFNIQLGIDPGVTPDPEYLNCAKVSGEADDDTPGDNEDCVPFPVNPPGPNLKVEKRHNWNGDNQLNYQIQVDNLGDETVSDVWITDTLPLDTHWDGWWDMDLDWSRLVGDIIVDGDQLIWNFTELFPGERVWIQFNANLDNPGQPMVWYTNIVEISNPPGETDPGNNVAEDIAFSGPEIEYIDLNVYDNYLRGRTIGHPITITTAYEQDFLGGGDFDWYASQNFLPGDVITIAAGAGLAPVVIVIPDPFDAVGSSLTDEVTGQVDHLDGAWLAVDLNGQPPLQVQTDSSGNFSASFPDIPRGGQGEVRYYTQVDYTDVTFHRHWRSQDLMLEVNYRDDWATARYEVGHTLWITVTESNGTTVKATAEVTSQFVDPWNDTGFTTSGEDWSPSQPDIQPGDWVFGRVDNGYTSELQIFTINGSVDVDNDHLTGNLDAPWYVGVIDLMDVQCHPWGAWNQGWNDVQVKNSQASPDGSVPFFCGWDPNTEWDVDYGQQISVRVPDLDGDQVVNVFEGEAVEMAIWKWQQGNYARPGGVVVYGHYFQNNGNVPAENVQISDELPPFTSYAVDTSPYPVTVGPGQAVTWDLGTVEPGQDGYIWLTLNVSPTAPLGAAVIGPNCVNISTSTTPELDPGNDNFCSDPVDVWQDDVELSLEKWTEPYDPTPGQEFVYRLQWCNNRGAAAGPAWLTDTLPAGATFLEWREPEEWLHLWYQWAFDGSELTLYAPGLPGDQCHQIDLLMTLDPDVPLGAVLRNTAVLEVADDVDLGNNFVQHDLQVSPPRYDLQVGKRFHNGALYPGGDFNYHINYSNSSNTISAGVVTDTVPAGLTFTGAYWGGGQDDQGQPLPDPVVIGDLLVWTLEPIAINDNRGFHVEFTIPPDTVPGTEFGNCVEIAGDGPDANPGDNTACETITINPLGPNLRVFKESWWNNNNQELSYQITFLNVGNESFFDITITDTLPAGTSMMNEPTNDYGNTIQNIDLGENIWQFIVEEINPGDMGRIYFDLSLDDPWLRPVWYTNIVEIEIPPGDVDPGDNYHEDVAFTGGELSRVEFWLNISGPSSMWGEAVPGAIITVTTAHGQYNAWADDPGCNGCWNIDDAGLIEPGDTIEVIAGAGIIPVVATIPDPLTAEVDTATGEVFGQIGSWSNRPLEVHGQWTAGYQEVTSDGAGNFLAYYPDMPRGAYGYVRFIDEVNDAQVIYHRPFNSLDLVLDINYAHDWVEGLYEAGHTIWITITESDGTTVKGLAELYSDPIPDWGGQSGFSPNYYGGWIGEQPDLLPGDWVFGQVDNGYTSTAHIGTITGELDVGADTISGTVTADWFDDPLAAACGVWVQDGPGLDMMVDPHGGSYFCDFSPTGWDILPGQDVGVSYWEPDGDRINNVFAEPAPHLWIDKNARSEAGEGGRIMFYISYQNQGSAPAEDVIITDTMSSNLSYLHDTSGFPRTGDDSGPLTWQVGTVDPGEGGFFMIFAEVNGLESEPVSNMAAIATSNPYDQGSPQEKQVEWNGLIQANDVHLTVDKSSWTPDPVPGGNLTFEVNVCNNGSTGSNELLLTDTFQPGITLVDWSTVYEDIYEVERAVDHLTIGRLSAPGNWCGQIQIEVHLDDSVLPGDTLANTVTIAADNDLETEDNTATWQGQAGEPHTNLQIWKWFQRGQLTPGGDLVYHVRVNNTGNLPVGPFVVTDTLPAGTTLLESWLTDNDGNPIGPLDPDLNGSEVVWSFDGLANGHMLDLEYALTVDPDLEPGTLLTNTAEVTRLPGEDTHEDNTAEFIEVLNPLGPNLRVNKWHQWRNEGRQLAYNISIQNIGTAFIDELWLTDTLPAGTTWNGWWDTSYEPEQQLDFTPEAGSLTWHFGNLPSGEVRYLWITVDLNPDSLATIYTNTLSAIAPPGDVNPDDDEFVDVAYVEVEQGALWISPTISQIQLDGTVTVDVMVGGIADLYGASFEIHFDPAALEVVDADGGEPGVQIEPGDCPVPSLVVVNEVDNSTGTINYDTVSLNPAPPCEGGGLMARITFRALAVGEHGVVIVDWLLSNTVPQPIPVIAGDGAIHVSDLALIQGAVELQSRTDHSGAEVCADGGGANITCTTTGAAGAYELWVAGGTYTVTAEMGSYLDGQQSGVIASPGGVVALQTVKLLGGDTNNDCLVNILDLAFMGARFGYSLGDPSFDPRADINNDGHINILDLSVSGGNYQKRCPVPWAPWTFLTVPGLPEGAVPVNLYSDAPDNLYVWFELYDADPLTRTADLAHWDGSSWTVVLSYPGYTQGRIHGNGPDDIFVSASCSGDCTGYETPHLAHFDGAAWQEQTVPPEVGSYIMDISGAPGEVQAATYGNPDNNPRIIIRYNYGTGSWNYLYTPPESIKSLNFLAPDEAYFVTCWGHGRWNGSAWSYKHEFDFCDVSSVWGVRDGSDGLHLYTVGKNNFDNGVRVWKYTEDSNPALLGTFGSKCGFVFGDPTSGVYICGGVSGIGGASGVWGADADNVYVVGLLGGGSDPDSGRVYLYDGSSWERLTGMGDIPLVTEVGGSGPDNVWFTLGDGRLMHYGY